MLPKKSSTSFLFLCLIIGALIGGGTAEILKIFFPTGNLQKILTNTLSIGVYPPLTVDILIFAFTIGFQIKLNFFLLIGMLLGIYIYKNM